MPQETLKKISVSIAALLVVATVSIIPSDARAEDLDPHIVKLVGSVSEERLGILLKKLESFETRSTLSSTESTTRGIGAAREWILKEMQSYSPKLQVSFDSYNVVKQGRITRDVEIRNVMAVLPGKSPRRIYISGHYDTVAFAGGQGNTNAGGTPGARNPSSTIPLPA
jgi:acetylornithine deacetylase/succinyl-diaminopimelate desuccinylase-like protein